MSSLTEWVRRDSARLGLEPPEQLYGKPLYDWFVQQVEAVFREAGQPVQPRTDAVRVRKLKPFCHRGHEFTPENTRYLQQPNTGTWYRQCQACLRMRSAAANPGV